MRPVFEKIKPTRAKNDCVIRSFAIATGRPYSNIYALAKFLQESLSGGVTFPVIQTMATWTGFARIEHPEVVSVGDMEVDEGEVLVIDCYYDHDKSRRFGMLKKRNRKTYRHLTSVSGGVLKDTFDCRNYAIKTVWKQEYDSFRLPEKLPERKWQSLPAGEGEFFTDFNAWVMGDTWIVQLPLAGRNFYSMFRRMTECPGEGITRFVKSWRDGEWYLAELKSIAMNMCEAPPPKTPRYGRKEFGKDETLLPEEMASLACIDFRRNPASIEGPANLDSQPEMG